MQALRFIEPGNIQQVEIPEPDSPGAGEALVRVHQVGVCGTDISCLLYTSPSPRDATLSRMPSSA